jgi:putative intracellular protease/amidase
MSSRFKLHVMVLAAAVLTAGPVAAAPSAPAAATADARAVAERVAIPPLKAGRTRPLVAIIADNAGAESTDVIIPYGVLKTSGVAEVEVVGLRPGAVRLMPALTIGADTAIAAFDTRHPEGADVVIVPAMHNSKNPETIGWIRDQARKGALIVSICEGARIVAAAGLFDGKRATTHWAAMHALEKAYPGARWVRDRRYVTAPGVMSTTGVTASLPASLALVEAIAGPGAAQRTARELGVVSWGPEHRSSDYQLEGGNIATGLGNMAVFWNHERISIPVADGVDEMALAFASDAWSRTFRSQATAFSARPGPVTSRNGLRILPDEKPSHGRVTPPPAGPSASGLDRTLTQIGTRYGRATAAFVALQLEYPWRPGS